MNDALRRTPGTLLAILIVAVLAPAMSSAHGVPQHELDTLARGGNLAYVWLGAKHMVTGYDHLLFLFGVVFFLTRIEARLESAETADRSSGQEWVVVFGNAKAPAPQSKLYVFLSLTGEYLAANFTGR